MEVLADRSSLSAGFIIGKIYKTSQFENFCYQRNPLLDLNFESENVFFVFHIKPTAGKLHISYSHCAIGSCKQLMMNSLLLAVVNS